MSYAPCKNPNCKSYGQPHPNCKCYGGMASGGSVEPFCSSGNYHQPDCQYFAEGTPDSPVEAIPEGYEAVEDTPEPAKEDNQEPIPEGYEAVDEEIPEGYEPVEENEEPGFRVPAGLEDAENRLGTNGLLQTATKPVPEGRLVSKEEWDKLGSDYEDYGKAGLLLTGGGAFGIAEGAIAKAVQSYANFSKVGSGILSKAISAGLIQGADEVSQWALGQGDPQHSVGAALANMGEAFLWGGAFGTGEAALKGGAKKLASTKTAGLVKSFLAGVGAAAEHAPDTEVSAGLKGRDLIDEAMKDFHSSEEATKMGASLKAYEIGKKAFDKSTESAVNAIARGAAAKAGYLVEGVPGAMAGLSMSGGIAKPVANYVERYTRPAAKKIVAPLVMKILSSGDTNGMVEALQFFEHANAGDKAAEKAVQSLMSGTTAKLGYAAKNRDKIKKWIDNSGIDGELQQEQYNDNDAEFLPGMAEGGEVKKREHKPEKPGIQHDGAFGTHYPDQNMMLAMARSRISNYLTGLKPSDGELKLPFDDAPDQTEKKRKYDRAIDIAANPLSIMHEIGRGTLEPDHLQHFNAMHPELKSLLQKKLIKSVFESQMNGKKPPYHVRQALSMFMGTELSSEMSPSSIQAAQNVFAIKKNSQQQQAAGGTPKSSKAALSKSDQAYLTGSQALARRAQKV